MVEHHDDRGVRDLENRVDVEVVLGRLVVVGKDCLVENGPRLESTRGDDDVATQVVPCAQVTEGDDAADSLRLRVLDATLRARVDRGDIAIRRVGIGWPVLGVVRPSWFGRHQSFPSAAITCGAVIDAMHGPPTGQVLARHSNPRKFTLAWCA